MDHSYPAPMGAATLATLALSALLGAGCGGASAPAQTTTDQRVRQAVPTQSVEMLSSVIPASVPNEKIAGEPRRARWISMAERIKVYQWNETTGCDRTNPYYGGTSRDGRSSPDLLSTAMALEVLRLAGLSEDDPQIQRALVFVSRCQHPEERPTRRSGGGVRNAGGFTLGPMDDAQRHGDVSTRLVRPCGAATSIGISSLIAAGVAPEDVRIQGALRWLKEHYSLDVHPGMARTNEGLYLYYYEFAKAMRALKLDELHDARGVAHDWRLELEQRLALRQRPDGSWVNREETSGATTDGSVTTTSYALLTLSQIHKSRGVERRPRRRPSIVTNAD